MSDQPDFWQLTDQWIAAVRERYKDQKRGDLTQIFMRGPFAGWSERQIAQFADEMHEKNTIYPIKKHESQNRPNSPPHP